MTEFTEQVRHYCRNPKCRSKLPAPVANEREAFCVRGCHSGFYRRRCLVCEREMERKAENQLICRRRKCRAALRAGSLDLGRYHIASAVTGPLKNPIKPGSKSGAADDRTLAPSRWPGIECDRTPLCHRRSGRGGQPCEPQILARSQCGGCRTRVDQAR